jgi:hypothetical protein
MSADLRTWGELYHPQVAVLGIGGVFIGPVTPPNCHRAKAAGDPAPVQLIAELSTQDPDVAVAVLDFGDTWTAGTTHRQRTS